MLRDALESRSVGVEVEVSGRLLVDAGAVERRYIGAVPRTVEKLGPYAVIAPGVAIPHARPEDGANRVGLSLVVLRANSDYRPPASGLLEARWRPERLNGALPPLLGACKEILGGTLRSLPRGVLPRRGAGGLSGARLSPDALHAGRRGREGVGRILGW